MTHRVMDESKVHMRTNGNLQHSAASGSVAGICSLTMKRDGATWDVNEAWADGPGHWGNGARVWLH